MRCAEPAGSHRNRLTYFLGIHPPGLLSMEKRPHGTRRSQRAAAKPNGSRLLPPLPTAKGHPVPCPVLRRPPSSMRLHRLAFQACSAQLTVQCSCVATHPGARTCRRRLRRISTSFAMATPPSSAPCRRPARRRAARSSLYRPPDCLARARTAGSARRAPSIASYLSEVSKASAGTEQGRRSDRHQVGRKRVPPVATITRAPGKMPDAPTIRKEQSLVFFNICQICQF